MPTTVLRDLRPADLDDVYLACQDPESQRWTTIPVPYERQHAEDFVAKGGQIREGSRYWVITDTPEGRFGGGVDLRPDGSGGAEVGYMVAPWLRGRGHGSRALRMACEIGFRDLGLEVITWYAVAGNEASRATAQRAGFRVLDGTLRRHLPTRGERLDGWYADLLPSDLGL